VFSIAIYFQKQQIMHSFVDLRIGLFAALWKVKK
jgi:hypothetical protein